MKILIVDDTTSDRILLKSYLKKLNHEVYESSNGIDALNIISTILPDILITDIIMPEIDGIELIEKVKMIYPDMYIIAMSGGSELLDTSYLEVASAIGANKVLQKPINKINLEIAINGIKTI